MSDQSVAICWRRGLLSLVLSTLAYGCASTPPAAAPKVTLVEHLESHCAPASATQDQQAGSSAQAEPSQKTIEPAELALPPRIPPPPPLSPRAWEMATIVAIDELLRQVQLLQQEVGRDGEAATMRLLKTRRQLSDRLLLTLIEAGSIAAELDCERARAEELAVRLEEIQNDIQHSRTIRAIVGEAGLQMMAGVLLIAGLPAIAGGAQIGGNANALGHGIAALGGEQHTDLTQARNLLQEIWEGPEEPRLFPKSVWRFLNQPANAGTEMTRREAIVSVWRGRLGPSGSETEQRRRELFFGRGGSYGVEELRHRADMLALLKAFVNLMNQELNLLFREALVLLNHNHS